MKPADPLKQIPALYASPQSPGARPAEGKKGADKGIDGKLTFVDGPKLTSQSVILSVKAGKLQAHYVRDLRGVIEREGAAIGVLLTMQEPTQQMRTEAASAGLYHSDGWNRDYPRLQIITVGELLDRRQIDMPPIRQVSTTFRKAPKVKADDGATLPMAME